jgi:hypothetical protein
MQQHEKIQEILKCGKDPIYFIKKYVKIQHPKRGTIPFLTYDFQDNCVRDFVNHRFNIIVKSRQLGLSTVTAGFALWLAIFHKDKNILVIATKLPTAVNFIKKVKFMLNSLPPWLLLTEFRDTQQSVVFSNGSEIKAIPTSEDAGRSEALSLLIVDEAAHVRYFDEIWAGLYPTLSTGGSAILISTPKGVGGTYHKIYSEAVAGVNNFNHINLPWHVHPEHDEEWFREDSKQFAGDLKKIAQEYLCDFVSSGDTFLQVQQMDWLKSLVKPPIAREGDGRRIWIWEHPRPGRKYIMSADVSRGNAADYSAFHIIDTSTTTVVAEYKGKIAPDDLGVLMVEWATKYNKALVCPEYNSYGFMTWSKMRDLKYTKFYYKAARYNENYVPTETDKPGFDTQGNTKIQALSKLEELIRNQMLKTYSQRLIDELQTYVWNGSKASALKGYNDDLVMSAAIGAWLIDTLYGTQSTTDINDLMARSIIVSRRNVVDIAPQVPIIGGGPSVVPTRQRQLNHAAFNQGGVDLRWLLGK